MECRFQKGAKSFLKRVISFKKRVRGWRVFESSALNDFPHAFVAVEIENCSAIERGSRKGRTRELKKNRNFRAKLVESGRVRKRATVSQKIEF